MPIVTPDTSKANKAHLVIADMRRVLRMRYTRRISRKRFLAIWSGLRNDLRNTWEYRNWRHEVMMKNDGLCACGAKGIDPHHKIPVAMNPNKALDISNGEPVCADCHAEEHPDFL